MPANREGRSIGIIDWLVKQREIALAGLLAITLCAIALRAPEYATFGNATNVLINASVLCILVVGQLFVLLAGGIDLSTAAILAFTGMFLALLSHVAPSVPAVAYIGLAAGLGLGLGAVNGVLVAFVRVPPIICTLGTMAIYRGLIFILSRGAWVTSHEMSERFKSFPLEKWLGLPNIVTMAVLIGLGAWLFLKFTTAGRAIYAVGGNPLAARYAGLSESRTKFLVFSLSGLISGIAGYLWTARFAIAYTQAAEGREFAIIAACVIGGVSIAGGKGSVAGAILGALFISVIESALPFVRVSPFLQTAISGTMILLAVAVNARGERRRGRQILEVRHAVPGATTRIQTHAS